ncbi:MAG: exodeoxyribonuclease VII small subunit [Cellvibrionales bacterium]
MPKKPDNSPDAPTLKEQMEALATIVEKLEDPDIDLEESLALYERGMALVATAGKVLEAAEQRVAMVTGDGEVQAIEP